MAQVKNKRKNKKNAGLADKVHNNNRANKKTLNPFEVHINREKLKVLGKKSKHDRGLPGVSRAKATQKRKETLGTELKLMNKTNAFIDRRIGEKNNHMSAEDRMVARFAAERGKQHSKKSIYNLADDEVLTHRGQTLEQIEKFDDPRSSDDDDEDKRFAGLGDGFVSEGHFGGGVLSMAESKDGAKSHKQLIEQLIAESKKRKADKQKEKEQTLDLTEKLDSEWKDLQPVVFKCQKEKEESLIDKLLSKEEKGQDYDKTMRELRFEKRGTPSDGLLSKEKQEEEERKKLEMLENQRYQRMFSEEELAGHNGAPTLKHRSADELTDNCAVHDAHPAAEQAVLAYDAHGRPLLPEHVLRDFSVPNARKKIEDGVSDSSDDDVESGSGDDSDDEEDDPENMSVDSDDESSKNTEVDLEKSDADSSSDESDEILKNNVSTNSTKKKSKHVSYIAAAEPEDMDDDDRISNKKDKINVNNKKRSRELDIETKQNMESKECIKKSKEEYSRGQKEIIVLKRKLIEVDEDSQSNSEADEKRSSERKIHDLKKLKLFNPDSFQPQNDNKLLKIETHIKSDNEKTTLLYPNYFPPKNCDKNICALDSENYDIYVKNDKSKSNQDDVNSEDNQKYSQSSEEEGDIDEFKISQEADQLDDCCEIIAILFDVKLAEQDILKELLAGSSPARTAALQQVAGRDARAGVAPRHRARALARLMRAPRDVARALAAFARAVPLAYDLLHVDRASAKRLVVELLAAQRERFWRHPARVPDLDTLLLFKLVSALFPTSDFRHPVATPALAFMAEILTRARCDDAHSLTRGLLVTSLALEYCACSRRYVPEALRFLRGVLSRCGRLQCDCSRAASPRRLAAADLAQAQVDDALRIRCLWTATLMLSEFFDYYSDLEAAAVIFEPHVQLLRAVDAGAFPSNVREAVAELLQRMTRALDAKTFTRMARERVAPKALRLYEPDVQDVFTGSKSGKLPRESAARARLRAASRREMKGALREIRRDKAYIASVKIRQKIRSDDVRKEKVKQIYKDASVQQGELNSLKRGK